MKLAWWPKNAVVYFFFIYVIFFFSFFYFLTRRFQVWIVYWVHEELVTMCGFQRSCVCVNLTHTHTHTHTHTQSLPGCTQGGCRATFPGRAAREWWSVRIQSRGSLKDHVDSHLSVIINDGGVARGGGEGNEQVYMCVCVADRHNVMIHSYTNDFHKCVLIEKILWKTLNENRSYSRILNVYGKWMAYLFFSYVLLFRRWNL